MVFRWWILSFFFLPIAFAAEPCGTTSTLLTENTFQAGLTVGMYLPTRFPNFQSSELSYGPTGRIPVGIFSLHPTVLYGSGDGVTFWVFDVAFRFTMPSPLFPVFVFAGPQYMHYSFAESPHDYFGGTAGFGLSFALSSSLLLELAAKEYFSADMATSLGATVLFRL
jgi:hypothetical protein